MGHRDLRDQVEGHSPQCERSQGPQGHMRDERLTSESISGLLTQEPPAAVQLLPEDLCSPC